MPFSFCGKISLQTFRVLASPCKSHIPAPHLFHTPTSFVTWRICLASRFSLPLLSLPRGSLPQTVCVCSETHLVLPEQVTFSFSQYNGQKTSLSQSVLLWVPWTLNIRVFKSYFLLFVPSFLLGFFHDTLTALTDHWVQGQPYISSKTVLFKWKTINVSDSLRFFFSFSRSYMTPAVAANCWFTITLNFPWYSNFITLSSIHKFKKMNFPTCHS